MVVIRMSKLDGPDFLSTYLYYPLTAKLKLITFLLELN